MIGVFLGSLIKFFLEAKEEGWIFSEMVHARESVPPERFLLAPWLGSILRGASHPILTSLPTCTHFSANTPSHPAGTTRFTFVLYKQRKVYKRIKERTWLAWRVKDINSIVFMFWVKVSLQVECPHPSSGEAMKVACGSSPPLSYLSLFSALLGLSGFRSPPTDSMYGTQPPVSHVSVWTSLLFHRLRHASSQHSSAKFSLWKCIERLIKYETFRKTLTILWEKCRNLKVYCIWPKWISRKLRSGQLIGWL